MIKTEREREKENEKNKNVFVNNVNDGYICTIK